MSGMPIGLMRNEITIQTAPVVQSASGEEVYDWDNADEAVVWAQWLPAGTREAYLAQQRLESHVDGVFVIYDMALRPRPDNTRILFDGRLFDLQPYVVVQDPTSGVKGLEIAVSAHGEAGT